jgi:hypothetical protein
MPKYEGLREFIDILEEHGELLRLRLRWVGSMRFQDGSGSLIRLNLMGLHYCLRILRDIVIIGYFALV